MLSFSLLYLTLGSQPNIISLYGDIAIFTLMNIFAGLTHGSTKTLFL